MIKFCIIFCLSFICIGCYQTTKEAVLENNIKRVREAFKKVTDSIDVATQTGQTNYTVFVDAQFYDHISYFDTAEYVIQMPVSKTMLNNYNVSTIGVVRFKPLDINTTLYIGTFASPDGDTKAYSNVFYELTRQQLILDKKSSELTKNEIKSKSTFYRYNTISSTWAYYYVQKNNPLISSKTKTMNFIANGFFDALCYMPIVAIPFSKGRERATFISLAIFSNLFYKYITAGFSADLTVYNKFARTRYNLKEIKD